jgi:subtilase family serine protease
MLALVAVVPPLAGKDTARTVLRGNVHPAVANLMPLAKVDDRLPMEHMLLSLRMGAEARADLERLLRDQQDPASPRYHQWLTPDQFSARFGPSTEEIQKVTGWLANQGFSVEEVGRTGLSVTFSGDAATVEQAFRTPIMQYQVDGETRYANAVEPSIPSELEPVVDGVVTLHNIPKRRLARQVRNLGSAVRPLYSYGGSNYLAPVDFATIYGVSSLYSQGYTGDGASIAVIGRSYPTSASTYWSLFRSTFSLPSSTVHVVFPNGNPGTLGSGEDLEADLDVEWAGAVAKNATITFVCGKSSSNTDGIDYAIQYVVNQNLADVMTVSFGACESELGTTGNAFYNNYWSAAAALGITVCVASGDSGAAGCDSASQKSLATGGLGVNGLASTPYNVCVGGTQFHEGTGTYWSTGTGTGSTALSYIPEVVWNESSATPDAQGYYDLYATGGGASVVYAKPSWQAATGVPTGNYRYVPDVSLSSGGHDGYLVVSQGSLAAVGGTSAASPAFAGLVALLVQKAGHRQGNLNIGLYTLGASQYGASGASVFHDISSGDNSVPGQTGFSAGTGYDQATGLGSVDVATWFANWGGSFSLSPTGSVGLLTGSSLVLTAAVAGVDGGASWSVSPSAGATVSVGGSTLNATFKATTAGTYLVTSKATDYPANAATLQVVAHANLTGSGTSLGGKDVLEVLGHWGTGGAAYDVTGDGLVNDDDLSAIETKLGWQ